MQTLLPVIAIIQTTLASTTCDCSNSCSPTISDDFIYCSSKQSCLNYDLTVTETLWCTGNSGCQNADITTTGSSNPYVKCAGYFSCRGAIINLGAYSGFLWCDGQDGCFQSTIATTYTGANDYDRTPIYCRGRFGCRLATISTDYWLYCDGNYACLQLNYNQLADNNGNPSTYAIIICEGDSSCVDININSANQIWCRGYKSCSDTTIKNVDYISGAGHYALEDSEIRTTGLSDLDVKLKGYLAGDGLDIYCNSGVDCTVYCDGWGCKGTVIYYYNIGDITINGHSEVENKFGELNIVCKLSMFQGEYYAKSVWCPTLVKLTTANMVELQTKETENMVERAKRLNLID